MEEKKYTRNSIVDILRGIAAIAVIAGHSIQRGVPDYYLTTFLFKLIYTFHMPLFILLSGYTFYLSKKGKVSTEIFKRVKRLLIPLIIWSIIMFLVKDFKFVGIKEFILFPTSFCEYLKTLLTKPDFIFWFLWIIFVYDVLFILLRKIKKTFFEISTIAVYFLFLAIPNNIFGGLFLKAMYPYFLLGFYLSCYSNKINIKKIAMCLLIPSILFYIIFFTKFNYFDSDKFVYYGLALSGIVILYLFTILIDKYSKYIKKLLIWFGNNSLCLYLSQCLFLNIGIGTGKLRVITIFISATTLSILFTTLVSKTKYTKKILFGK